MSAASDVDVLVVGAGLAGVTCAQRLRAAGLLVQVLDKSRGLGGRMATRRGEHGQFDHGAQYFTARDPAFIAALEPLIEAGTVAQWPDAITLLDRHGSVYERDSDQADGDVSGAEETRYVGVPGMSSLVKAFADGLAVTTGAHVDRLERTDGGWRLLDAAGTRVGAAPEVVLATPAEQARALAYGQSSVVEGALENVLTHPCIALMLTFASPLGLPYAAARPDHPILGWIANDGSKPGRNGAPTWVVHATAGWSARYVDADPDALCQPLTESFRELTAAPEPTHAQVHRWRYAKTASPRAAAFIRDAEAGLSACGDYCFGARVEGAFMSGAQLADRILRNGA